MSPAGDDTHNHYKGVSDDFSAKANRKIWAIFIGLGLSLALTLFMLDVYFRDTLDSTRMRMSGAVQDMDLVQQRQQEASVLGGDIGLVEGKKHISITEAMDRYVSLNQ
jgi:hypothetical protein